MPRRDELDDSRPWYAKPGFLVAAAFVMVVLVVGLVVTFGLASRGGGSDTEPSATTADAVPEPPDADQETGTAPAETSEGAAPPEAGGDTDCETPAGTDPQAGLTTPPEVEWLPVGLVSTAVSEEDGPADVDSQGFARCYAQTSSGALLAAHNFLADLRNPKEPEVHQRLIETMVAGEGLQTELLGYINDGEGNTTPISVVGYRFVQSGSDTYVVSLVQAVPGQTGTGYVMEEVTLQWQGDWQVSALSDPSQISEIPTGYVPWGDAATSER